VTNITTKFAVAGVPVLVLDEFIKVFKTEIPQLRFVYSQKSDFVSTLSKYINDNQATSENRIFPLFSFKRSTLRWTEEGGPGRRNTVQLADKSVLSLDDNNMIHRVFHGEFDIDFVYLDSGIDRLEQFEILYLGNKGMSQQNELTVNLGELLGDFRYYVRYGELSDFNVEMSNHHYQGISGSATVMGFYFILTDQAGPLIHQINLKIENFFKEVLYSGSIVG